MTAAAILSFCTAAGAAGFETAAPAELGISAERLERLTDALEAYVDERQVAGSVALVLRDGRIAYFEAFGVRDLESGAPMRKDTLFRIASQTKAVVSAAALILQEEGRLLIGEPVGKYIPAFDDTTVAVATDDGYDIVPAERKITIRDLLTHTSGYDYGEGLAKEQWAAAGIQGYYFAGRDEPIGETVARMAALPAQSQPGTKFVYGYSTDILGAVLEVAAGMPLDELLADRIFEPLGMRDTHFYLPRDKAERLATVYEIRDGRISRTQQEGWNGQGGYVEGPRRSFSGGAGLVSTAEDYARFLQMVLGQGEFDGVRVMSRKSVELMSVDHLGDVEFAPGEGFGLGFSVLEDLGERGTPGSVGELGWGGAYHTSYWIDPAERLVVVYMTQLVPAGDVDDHEKLRALVYQALERP
ncbi:MAG TPA: serine hydrolase domain-containing protein [Woeseiaceae bacterium]|nr:serine hydrolase domain-containing protein [Woeseiaceae bacterium]